MQGTLHSCQVDTAVTSATKVSRDVRRKEALLRVEFGPRRELQLLSQALWNQQKERFSLIIRKECLWFPPPQQRYATPHNREEGWVKWAHSPGTQQRQLVQTKRATPGLITLFRIMDSRSDSALETTLACIQGGHSELMFCCGYCSTWQTQSLR